MPEKVNQRINTFLGLNNMLNPASAEYREGMAYRAKNSRLDKNGLWSGRPTLVGCNTPPATLSDPHGGGTHFKNLAIENTNKIISNIGVGTIVDVGSNGILYSTTGSGAIKGRGVTVSAFTSAVFTRPDAPTVADTGVANTRAEDGTYYYMTTWYDPVRQRESLPSPVVSIDFAFEDGVTDSVAITANGTLPTGYLVRIYRSKRINATDAVYNPANIFYFVAEQNSKALYNDLFHDDEIANFEYEGRGTAPPQDVNCLVSFNNRMLYFVGNTLYWSSAGRPDEVAQEYTLSNDVVITMKPKLGKGIYAEAKYDISELSGQTVLGAMVRNGKCYVWTAGITGYIEATNKLEGYRFKTLREGIGLVNDKCLASTPYGIFGADRQGIWLLDNTGQIKRISDGVVDIYSGNYTTLTQSNITNSFGVWIPALNDFWWSVSNVQIVYQADRKIFTGPYTHSISGGTNFVSAGGAQAYLTGSRTASPTTAASTAQNLEFWMGQSDPTSIKDQLIVEVVHNNNDGTATAVVGQYFATGETANAIATVTSYSEAIAPVKVTGSGRLFKLTLTVSSATRKLATINYKYNSIEWSKNFGR